MRKINLYGCEKCHWTMVTVDFGEGVTPMMAVCRSPDNWGGRRGVSCDGTMISRMYRDGPYKSEVPQYRWVFEDGVVVDLVLTHRYFDFFKRGVRSCT